MHQTSRQSVQEAGILAGVSIWPMRTGAASDDAEDPRWLQRLDRRAPKGVDLASGAGTKADMAGRQRVVESRRRRGKKNNSDKAE